jgi:CRP/FNR family transcriptional regulator
VPTSTAPGEPLAALFAIRSGFMKSCVLHDDGREQIAGFHMAGDARRN